MTFPHRAPQSAISLVSHPAGPSSPGRKVGCRGPVESTLARRIRGSLRGARPAACYRARHAWPSSNTSHSRPADLDTGQAAQQWLVPAKRPGLAPPGRRRDARVKTGRAAKDVKRRAVDGCAGSADSAASNASCPPEPPLSGGNSFVDSHLRATFIRGGWCKEGEPILQDV